MSRLSQIAVGARRSLPYLILGSCLVVYLCPFIRFLPQGTDEGTFLYGAVRVTKGEVPFRDFFEVMGPGSFYWVALFFKLFGTSFFSARISLALTSLCTGLLMYFLARRLRIGYPAVPAVLFLATSFGPLWPTVSHHNDSNLWALASFAVFAFWIDTRRSILLAAAGALAGVTTCFMQPKGILLFLSFVVLAVLLRGKAKPAASLFWLAGGYLAVGITILFLYWRAGALPDLIYANVVWPLTQYSAANVVPYGQGIRDFYWTSWTTALGAAISPAAAVVVVSFLLIPFLFVAALPATCAWFALLYRRLAFDSLTLPYWVAGAALWLSEIHRKDIMHLVYGAPLLMILCLHFLARARHRLGVYAYQFVCISAFALAGLNGLAVLAANTPVSSRRGVFYTARRDPVLEFVNAHIEPGESIFVYPWSPMYYFLSDGTNPTRFSFLMYRLNTDAQFREALEALQEKRAHYVIWDHDHDRMLLELAFGAHSVPPPHQLVIEPYLTERYRVLKSIGGTDILERKRDCPRVR